MPFTPDPGVEDETKGFGYPLPSPFLSFISLSLGTGRIMGE